MTTITKEGFQQYAARTQHDYFRKGHLTFTFRVAAVIIRDGHVLLQHAVQQCHWFLTGGRAELRESTTQTITREMREELGIEVRVERLLWVVENFFELADIRHHELGLYFLVSIPDDAYLNNAGQSFIKTDADAGAELVFQWHPLEKLAAVPLYPSFLQEALTSLPEGTEHIVQVDG